MIIPTAEPEKNRQAKSIKREKIKI